MEKEIENLLSQWNIKDDVKDILRKEKLIVKQVNGKPALINPNIDLTTPFEDWPEDARKWIQEQFESGKYAECTWEPKENYAIDKTSNNAELMQNGYAPFDKNGDKYELHKIANALNAPIAELPISNFIRNNTIGVTDAERIKHWKSRGDSLKK